MRRGEKKLLMKFWFIYRLPLKFQAVFKLLDHQTYILGSLKTKHTQNCKYEFVNKQLDTLVLAKDTCGCLVISINVHYKEYQ